MKDKQLSRVAISRDTMDDLASIKISEVESALEARHEEIKDTIKTKTTELEELEKAAYQACCDAAEKKHGSNLASAVKSLNATGIFPELEYGFHCYSRKDFDSLKKAEEIGVCAEVRIKFDATKRKIIAGGNTYDDTLPLTSVGRKATAQSVFSTTALIPVNGEVRAAIEAVNAAEKEISDLQNTLSKIAENLRQMGTIDRRVRAKIASKHLDSTDDGKQALQYLEDFNISEIVVEKNVVKALENKSQ